MTSSQHTPSVVRTLSRTLVSLVLLVGSMAFALKDVKNLHELWNAFHKANYWWVLATIPVMLLSHYLRALRWITMIKPIQPDIHIINAFSGVMIGYMVNNLTPRGGELARPFILSRRENVRFSTGIATILVERVIDILSLSVFVLITFYYFHNKIAAVFPQINGQALLRILVLPVVGLMAFIILMITTNTGEWLLRVTVKRFSEAWYWKLHNYLEAFIHGFSIFKSPGLYWRVIFETIAIWGLYLVPIYFTFVAFGFDTAYKFGWFDANVLLTMTTIGITIGATPGAWGFYHYFAQVTLAQFYGVPSEQAVAFAFVAHGIGYFVNIIVGGLFFMREHALGISWHLVSHADEVASEAENIEQSTIQAER
ncbi:MAG: lysylphosphatidylglycerol synthase transmembrane domain-containing protein [Bacteroidota bacterium]|nr:flippase-like domain-containing protein [Candidatus Kapabacteria bacterium]MDW8220185.1 lysylphosphatidylglycerol synthase transmembrane domain-containing protein [Bacteroidota bacterium]